MEGRPALSREKALTTLRNLRFEMVSKRGGMKSVLTHWGTALVLALSGVVLTRITCPGCVDRGRANSRCDWTGDTAFRVNAADHAQWRHLVTHVQLAEELAVRYADA